MFKSITTWLFSIPCGRRSLFGIIWWWECRRIPYNIIVGMFGFISWLLCFLFLNLTGEIQPGEDVVEPLAIMAFVFLINIAYISGWVVELLRHLSGQRAKAVGPFLFKFGLAFSLIVVMLPSLLWFVEWIRRSVGL